MDPVIGLLVVLLPVLSSFPLLKRLCRNEDNLTLLIMSFVAGISLIVLPLLCAGLLFNHGFGASSWIILVISVVLFIFTGAKYLDFYRQISKLKVTIKNANNQSILWFVFIFAIVFFGFKYLYLLNIKGIFDWDATTFYLPYARHITIADHITLTGFDYQPFVYPPGISVLYAWLFSLGNSPYDESFRLVPFLFQIMTIVIIYQIASGLGTKDIAKIAVIVYMLLPIHDLIIYYCSYYPDTLYYALILSTFFFLFTYFKKHDSKYCFFGGLSIGLGALLKPQFLLFLPVTLLPFLMLVDSNKLRKLLISLWSISIVIFYVFIEWNDPGYFFAMPLFTKVVAFAFIFLIATIIIIAVDKINSLNSNYHQKRILLRDISIFYAMFGASCLIWYIRNLILTGSILFSVYFKNANFQWALSLIASPTSMPNFNIVYFVLLFVLLPTSMFLLGTVWLFPKIVGLFVALKSRIRLILIVWVGGYLISYFCWNLHNYQIATINPRDFFFFAPFFSILCAFGILEIANNLTKKSTILALTYLLSSFGLLSLAQSILIYNYGPLFLKNNFGSLIGDFGYSLSAFSGILPNTPLSLLSSMSGILLPTCIITFIVFSPFMIAYLLKLAKVSLSIKVRINLPYKQLLKISMVFIMMFSLLVLPYLSMTYEFSGGRPLSFGNAQMKTLYDGLYTNVASYLNNHIKDGDVILTTDPAYNSLQYFVHYDVKVIALGLAGNLAELRDIVQNDNSSQIAESLIQLNVRYFLEPKVTSPFIGKLSNGSLLINVLRDPKYFQLAESFEGWSLYESISNEFTFVTGWNAASHDWTFYEKYSSDNASWKLASDGQTINVTVSGNSTVALQSLSLNGLNTTELQYVYSLVRGSSGIEWQFCLYSYNGRNYNFPWWGNSTENWQTNVYSINNTYIQNSILSQAIITVKNTNDNPATLCLDYQLFNYNYLK
jgi:hypothetical protein